MDVGCGGGNITAEISHLVPSGYVLGVDNWFQSVIHAIQCFPRDKYPNLRFLQADARKLQLKENPFDFVVSRGCLHFLDHPGRAFSAIARNLKPGGCMHVWCMGKGNAARINQTLRRMIGKPQWQSYFQDFRPGWSFATPISCQPWLQAARFKKNQAILVNQEHRFPDRSGFLEWLRWNWRGYFDRVPSSEYAQFVEEFLAEYGPSADGSYTAELVWLAIDATRR